MRYLIYVEKVSASPRGLAKREPQTSGIELHGE